MIPAEEIDEVRQFRFWLGSDRLGRDVLRDILVGGRLSLGIAGASVAIALLLGLAIGLTAATGGPVVDAILMRAVDGLLAFPVLFLVILVAALVRPSAVTLVPILGLTSWMGLARLVRGQVLSLRHRDYVRAAEAAGVRWHQIWRWHFLPNLAGPVGQDVALRTGDLVLAEATLSYLGIGVPATVPTWGAMVRDGHRVMLDGWWLSALPGLCIATLVVSLAMVADRVRTRTES
jgi:peptide/nickel transport system permease protein